jgi:putative pyruvate formate lyase activating enzyme
LSEIFLSLAEQGVSNLNLVTPTPWVEEIKAALTLAWDKGFWLPTVYNTSGYEEAATIDGLAGYISVYLPDFKYMDPALGSRLSGISDYPEVAKRALSRMVHQRGTPHITAEGLMTRGVIVRHLVLPGHIDDSKRVIGYLHETYGDEIYLSIMSQYTPMPGMEGELSRALTQEEYEEVVAFARGIGVTQAFLQEGSAVGESFIPAFNGEGILS